VPEKAIPKVTVTSRRRGKASGNSRMTSRQGMTPKRYRI
jgi:molybdenum-dependent DNA-binding transcriptional regulator ModE